MALWWLANALLWMVVIPVVLVLGISTVRAARRTRRAAFALVGDGFSGPSEPTMPHEQDEPTPTLSILDEQAGPAPSTQAPSAQAHPERASDGEDPHWVVTPPDQPPPGSVS